MAQIKLNATYGLTGNLPAVSAANLISLNGTQLTSGTIPNARYGTPTFNGSNLTNLPAGGIVKQVLVKALASNFSMNSGTTADVTNFSQAITMADTNNKLLVTYNLNIRMQGAGASSSPSSNFYITNAGNTVLANTYIHQAGLAANNKERTENSSGAILITPATTDAYTIKARVNNASEGGTVQIFGGGYTSSITLMEIVV
tara:strand:- start:7421 stop:8023 length:603 start_codon:yes stop_codon:yes gene_type:complete